MAPPSQGWEPPANPARFRGPSVPPSPPRGQTARPKARSPSLNSSSGIQSGPRIGLQKGPLCWLGKTGLTRRSYPTGAGGSGPSWRYRRGSGAVLEALAFVAGLEDILRHRLMSDDHQTIEIITVAAGRRRWPTATEPGGAAAQGRSTAITAMQSPRWMSPGMWRHHSMPEISAW